jgi:hypothetical protein
MEGGERARGQERGWPAGQARDARDDCQRRQRVAARELLLVAHPTIERVDHDGT